MLACIRVRWPLSPSGRQGHARRIWGHLEVASPLVANPVSSPRVDFAPVLVGVRGPGSGLGSRWQETWRRLNSRDNHALGTAHAFAHVTSKTDLAQAARQLGAS